MHLYMYMYGNTYKAFPTEPLDGGLRNLVGMKYHGPHVCIVFSAKSTQGWIQEGQYSS